MPSPARRSGSLPRRIRTRAAGGRGWVAPAGGAILHEPGRGAFVVHLVVDAVLVEEQAHGPVGLIVRAVEPLEQGLIPIVLEPERPAGEDIEARDLQRFSELGRAAVIGE